MIKQTHHETVNCIDSKLYRHLIHLEAFLWRLEHRICGQPGHVPDANADSLRSLLIYKRDDNDDPANRSIPNLPGIPHRSGGNFAGGRIIVPADQALMRHYIVCYVCVLASGQYPRGSKAPEYGKGHLYGVRTVVLVVSCAASTTVFRVVNLFFYLKPSVISFLGPRQLIIVTKSDDIFS